MDDFNSKYYHSIINWRKIKNGIKRLNNRGCGLKTLVVKEKRKLYKNVFR